MYSLAIYLWVSFLFLATSFSSNSFSATNGCLVGINLPNEEDIKSLLINTTTTFENDMQCFDMISDALTDRVKNELLDVPSQMTDFFNNMIQNPKDYLKKCYDNANMGIQMCEDFFHFLIELKAVMVKCKNQNSLQPFMSFLEEKLGVDFEVLENDFQQFINNVKDWDFDKLSTFICSFLGQFGYDIIVTVLASRLAKAGTKMVGPLITQIQSKIKLLNKLFTKNFSADEILNVMNFCPPKGVSLK